MPSTACTAPIFFWMTIPRVNRHLLLEDALLLGQRQVAGGRVVPVGRQELGDLPLAYVHHVRTARMESASRRHVDQRGRKPLDGAKPILLLLVQSRDGLE